MLENKSVICLPILLLLLPTNNNNNWDIFDANVKFTPQNCRASFPLERVTRCHVTGSVVRSRTDEKHNEESVQNLNRRPRRIVAFIKRAVSRIELVLYHI